MISGLLERNKIIARLKTPTFYFDMISIFPQFTMLYFTPMYEEHQWISAFYVVKLLKAHTFFSFLDNISK